ncbi:MAG: isocitrate lyase/phosphoenolpyruvate mutase family protein [Pseudomonadales bacterium]|nr:isocitrate lyase/phosphoenolpyruvate mutase family protein [Pseudomonadales bacterium]
MSNQVEKCEAFHRLHGSDESWVIPNPWDVGSAKLLQGMGFKALATTSYGFAFTLGRGDGAVSLDEKVQHCSDLAAATSIPINADFENGFSDDIAAMRGNIKTVVASGIAGLSVEDFSRDKKEIYAFTESVERVNAAAEATKEAGVPIVFTARAENLLRGIDDLEDTIKRLQAYAEAGADVLYAPGISSLEQLNQVCSAIDKPFNVLAPMIKGCTVQQLSAAGATRISVGGALTRAVLTPLLSAGKEMLDEGSFNWVGELASGKEVNQLLES